MRHRLCQRCDANEFNDVDHMILDCSSLNVERQKPQSLFARGQLLALLGLLFHPGPSRITGYFCA